MATFPVIRSGSAALYPLERGRGPAAGVARFLDGSEQRWQAAGDLRRFVLEYRSITGYEASLLVDFFRDAKGAFDDSHQITVGGTVYQNMAIDSDEIELVEDGKPDRWRISVALAQRVAA